MKYLTSITLVMGVPTIISGFFGMNVPVPLATTVHAFLLIALMTVAICAVIFAVLKKSRIL
jgi:magnesium transporter